MNIDKIACWKRNEKLQINPSDNSSNKSTSTSFDNVLKEQQEMLEKYSIPKQKDEQTPPIMLKYAVPEYYKPVVPKYAVPEPPVKDTENVPMPLYSIPFPED